MKLRTRIPVYLVTIMLVIVAVFYLTIAGFIFNSTRTIEKNSMADNMDRVQSAMDHDMASLQETADDYAAWTDTVTFVGDKNRNYIDQNYGSDSFANLKVNVVAIFDVKQQLLYARHYDWMADQDMTMSKDFFSDLEKHPDLFSFTGPHDLHSDYISFGGQMMFVATRPIVTSDYQGPVKGTLVMARHLDKTYMTTLSSLTSLKISLVPDISAGSIASIFAPDRLLTPGTQRVINFIDDNDMQAYFTLKDLGGNVVAVFEIDHDRSSNLLAIQLLENLLIVFALMAVLLVFTTIWLLDRFILGRLSKFSSQVMNYETNPGLIERIDIHRNDELTSLEKVAQRTFRELAVSRKKIKDHADKIGIERKKLDAILNGIAEGVFVVNREGKILMVNHEARRLSGWLSSELIAAPFYRKLKFLDKDQHLIDLNSLRQVFGKNPQIVTQGDAFFFPKNGSPIPVTLSAAPIRAHQDVFSSVVVFKDMSREHAIDKMKSEFVSITSHQLRTPLTGIKWMLSLLFQGNAGELNSKQLEYLRNVNTSNERMIQLVSDLLNISRIESMPAQQLENKDCDLAKLMHDVMAEQRASARVLGVVLRSDPAGVVGLRQPVTGDSEKLFQAFANLVNNAIKYSRRGGEVVVGSCIDGNFVRISFKDSGIGIPAAQQPMVFQKFFRADNALKSVAVGTGLGLYYVKSVIEAHGGKVWFSSVRNKGTTFYLTLPIKKQGAGINARARTP